MFHALMKRISSKSTKLVGTLWGEKLGFYYVSEYPRSGGTWLGQMLADYLQVAFPQQSVFPHGCASVTHNHWSYSSRLHGVFYLVRDGRDLVTSMFYYAQRGVRSSDWTTRNYFLRRFPPLAQIVERPELAEEFFPEFVESWFLRPYGLRFNWNEHVAQWAFDRSNVIRVSYEALREDCFGTMKQILERRLSAPVDEERLALTIEKFSFENQTGRRPGEEDPAAFIRKGIVGDWRNHFTREAGEIFQSYGGETLRLLGYESDAHWWRHLPERTAARIDRETSAARSGKTIWSKSLGKLDINLGVARGK